MNSDCVIIRNFSITPSASFNVDFNLFMPENLNAFDLIFKKTALLIIVRNRASHGTAADAWKRPTYLLS